MARLQVLYLPSTADGETPFALILDDLTPEQSDAMQDFANQMQHLRDRTGVRAVLCFPFPVDVA